MAFLLPLLGSLAGPALAGVASTITKKIIGDDPLNDLTPSQVIALADPSQARNVDFLNSLQAKPNGLEVAQFLNSVRETLPPNLVLEKVMRDRNMINTVSPNVNPFVAKESPIPDVTLLRDGQILDNNQRLLSSQNPNELFSGNTSAMGSSQSAMNRMLGDVSPANSLGQNSAAARALSLGTTQQIADVGERLATGRLQQLPMTAYSPSLDESGYQFSTPAAEAKLKTNQNTVLHHPYLRTGILGRQRTVPASTVTDAALRGANMGQKISGVDSGFESGLDGRALNQNASLINAYNEQVGGQRGPVGTTESMTAPGYADTVGDVGKRLNDSAKSGFNQVGKAISGVGGNLLSSLFPRIAGKLVQKGGTALADGLTRVVKKLVGDEPLEMAATKLVGDDALGTTFSGGKIKVVGDDPLNYESTPRGQDAAAASSSSVLMTLFGRMVEIEQLLLLDSTCVTAVGQKQLLQQLFNQWYSRPANFNLTYFRYNSDYVGCEWSIIKTVYYRNQWQENLNVDWASITKTVLVSTLAAPPMRGNVTYDAMAPLLRGASVSEYSSQLRIKTRRLDMDLMTTAMGSSAIEVEAGVAYSFCPMLAKVLAYSKQYMMIPGAEGSYLGSGVYYAFTPFANEFFVEWNVNTLFWTDVAWRTRHHGVDPDLWRGLKLAWVTGEEFVTRAVGINPDHWEAPFEPSAWGGTCAVVHILVGDSQDGNLNAAAILSKLQYPFAAGLSQGKAYSSGSKETIDIGLNSVCLPMIGGAEISGPKDTILIVVDDLLVRSGHSIIVGTGADSLIINESMGPGNPYSAPTTSGLPHNMRDCLLGFLNSGQAPATFERWLKHWENTFGNASDRSSAMRWLADNALAFGNPVYWGQNPDPTKSNPLDGFTFLGKYDNTDLGSYYANYNDITQNVLEGHRALVTTPTGIPRHNIAFNSTTSWVPSYEAPEHLVTHYTMGREDAMVEFLTTRGWLFPAEERPQTPMVDIGQTMLAARTLSVLMGGTSDLQSQIADIPETVFWLGMRATAAERTYYAMARNNIIYPLISDLLQLGIQYPQVGLSPKCFEFANTTSTVNTAFQVLYPTLIANPGIRVPRSRVPYIAMERFHPFFAVNDPRLNLSSWSKPAFVRELNGAAAVFFPFAPREAPVHPGAVEFSKLAMTALGTNQKFSPVAFQIRPSDGELSATMFSVTVPDFWRGFLFGSSAVTTAAFFPNTALVSLPMGCVPFSTDILRGGVGMWYALHTYREAFVQNAASVLVSMFSPQRDATSTLGAPLPITWNSDAISPVNSGDLFRRF